MASPPWLRNLSQAFKAHRLGRPGWYVEMNRDRLRVVSAELPPRPGDAADQSPQRRAFTLQAPPGPATSAAALNEACHLFDAVMEGRWSWPDPNATPAAGDESHLQAQHLERLTQQLRSHLVGERMAPRTWERTWAPYLRKLQATAAERRWADDPALLDAYLRSWPPNSRARQMAYDRARRLWKEAGWGWPEDLAQLRGNGRAAADPEGVRAFSDEETHQLREAIKGSRLTPADLVAWDCLICFGLRPKELQALELQRRDGVLVAVVSRSKQSSRGSSGRPDHPCSAPCRLACGLLRASGAVEAACPTAGIAGGSIAWPGADPAAAAPTPAGSADCLRAAPCLRPAAGPWSASARAGVRPADGEQPAGAPDDLRQEVGRADASGQGRGVDS